MLLPNGGECCKEEARETGGDERGEGADELSCAVGGSKGEGVEGRKIEVVVALGEIVVIVPLGVLGVVGLGAGGDGEEAASCSAIGSSTTILNPGRGVGLFSGTRDIGTAKSDRGEDEDNVTACTGGAGAPKDRGLAVILSMS